jgi:hypothetical protein
MIAWGTLLAHALWIGGLGIALALLSIAYHQAASEGVGLRERLAARGSLVAGYLAGMLVCLGLLLGASSAWVRLIAAGVLLVAVWSLGPHLQRERGSQAAASSALPSARSGWSLGCILLGSGLLIIMGWSIVTAGQVAVRARSLAQEVQQLRSLAEAGPTDLQSSDLAQAGQHLATIHEDLAVIDARIGPLLPLGRFLDWIPTYGGDLAAAVDLIDLGLNLTAAGDRGFQALSPALPLLEEAGERPVPGLQPGEQLLPILVAAQPELKAARGELEVVEQIRGRMDPDDLSPRVAGLLVTLDRYQPWFEAAVDGTLLAPSLLGADGTRTYLVVAQNNHELRATGGFVSGVGEMLVENGRIVSLSFQDSYAVDNFEVPHETAPSDLQATLSGQMWLFRDGNWDPDFVVSARQMLDIYARDQGVSADGLISVDLVGLELLVGAVGPLAVEGSSQPVTQGNVQRLLQEQWAEPESGPALEENWDREWWAHRKDFMGEVAAALMDKLEAGEGVRLGPLVGALKQALEEKHILLYLDDAGALALLRERNWDGALAGGGLPSRDFLMVVDTNVGFNKVDPNITRSIRYQVDLRNTEEPRARLTLAYGNRSHRPVDFCIQEARYGASYADMMDRCYWDYVRVYAPPGSRLLASPDLEVPAGSLLARGGTSVARMVTGAVSHGKLALWRAFFDLAPGQERTLVFDYALPPSVLEQGPEDSIAYYLLAQKQPGTVQVPLQLEVILPAGADLVRTLPADMASQVVLGLEQAPTLLLSTDLRVDRQISVVLER